MTNFEAAVEAVRWTGYLWFGWRIGKYFSARRGKKGKRK